MTTPEPIVELRERIYTAISQPVCERCQSRTDWGPSDCDKNCCHDLYAKETEAVLAIVLEQRVQGAVDSLDGVIRTANSLAASREEPSSFRLAMLEFANLVQSSKDGCIEAYKQAIGMS